MSLDDIQDTLKGWWDAGSKYNVNLQLPNKTTLKVGLIFIACCSVVIARSNNPISAYCMDKV